MRTFVMRIVQLLPLFCVSVTVTESPGFTASCTCRDEAGSISIHASYCTSPPLTVACVPAWMRSRVSMPPMPTHVASAPATEADTLGTIHVPVTEVYVPPLAAYPDQFDEVENADAAGPVTPLPGWVCGAGCATPLG